MPSPCEVVPDEVQCQPLVMLDGERPRRPVAHRVIPAIAGGLFAGLLLVGLGCTPLFQPQGATAAAENPVIVQSSTVGGKSNKGVADSKATGRSSAEVVGSPAIAASPAVERSATRQEAVATAGGSANDEASGADANHGFVITCLPEHTDAEPGARPEKVSLQGIMAGSRGKAALLDGSLYREGDRFGARHCPWTIAMIDAASVRIEKAFGDRVCGVTIRLSNADNQKAAGVPRNASARSR